MHSTRHDLLGHPMASWDTHSSCRSCLHKLAVFCTRLSPCSTCKSCSPQQWRVWELSELPAAEKCRHWAETSALKAATREESPDPAFSWVQLSSAGTGPSVAVWPESLLMPPPARPPSRHTSKGADTVTDRTGQGDKAERAEIILNVSLSFWPFFV